jgi:hypothetical protein
MENAKLITVNNRLDLASAKAQEPSASSGCICEFCAFHFAFCILGFAFFIVFFDAVAVGSALNDYRSGFTPLTKYTSATKSYKPCAIIGGSSESVNTNSTPR